MKQFIELLNETVGAAFEKAGFDKELGRVSVSNRPDLCEYQCNGAMSGAKLYHKKPIEIAEAVAAELSNSDVFEKVSAVMPGFLNLDISARYISDYVSKMLSDDKFGYENTGKQQTIVIDYGGPNVAKPLHVGHLRPAIIGESIKRISRYAGHKVIGDVHLGDWGMPMGQIITELKERKPELPYFDDSFDGEYPEEAPFTIS